MRVFFPCTGLGRQRRGFETFTLECAEALADDSRVELSVFSGGPVAEVPATVIANLARDSRGAHWLAALHRRGAYFSEQLTFFLNFLPHLRRGKPDVVYFADLNLGNLCWHWRRASGQRFRLLFYNGGLTTRPFTRADLVQQLTPLGIDEAIDRGEDPTRQVLLPHGVRMPDVLPPRILGADRARLGLPVDRPIVLSVGLLDAAVKRMDYLIREVASMSAPRPFLVILGAESPESDAIRRLAQELLGAEAFLLRTVERDTVAEYFLAADVFALASIREGFGLAYVEALAYGLPIIAHDFPVTRFLLDGMAQLVDLRPSGALASALDAQLRETPREDDRERRHASARERFSWSVLREEYSAMLRRAASMPMTGLS